MLKFIRFNFIPLLLLLSLAFGGGVCCAKTIAQRSLWVSIAPEVIDAIVMVEVIDGMTDEAVAGGTGFIVSPDGYIVTNAHVADMEVRVPVLDPQLWVKFSDFRKVEVQAKWMDPIADVAVLKIAGKNLPYLKFERSNDLQIGQEIMTIGHAYPFTYTLTDGVISNITRVRGMPVFFQHTSSINFGCSGGPIFSRNGKVVGINVAMSVKHNDIYFGIAGGLVKMSVKEISGLSL